MRTIYILIILTITPTGILSASLSKSQDGFSSESEQTTEVDINLSSGPNEVMSNPSQDGILLQVSLTVVNLEPSSGIFVLNVTSVLAWSVSDNVDWLEANEYDPNTVRVSYETNTSDGARSGLVTVTTGVETVKVNVHQDLYKFYITPTSRSVGKESGTTSFNVNANVGWSVTDNASWVKATKESDESISVVYYVNATITQRTANIYVTGDGGVKETLTLVQAAGDRKISISPNEQTVGSSLGNVSYTVSTNVSDWVVSTNAAWCTAARRVGDRITIDVEYEANMSTDSRTATITAVGDGVVTATTKLIQVAGDEFLEISPPALNVGHESGSDHFDVSSNINWSVSESVSWLNATKTSASRIDISYGTNDNIDFRSATITVSGGSLTKYITVTQDGTPAYLTATPETRNVSANAGSTTYAVDANVEWTAAGDVEWIMINPNDDVINITYEANLSTSSRTANITIHGPEGAVSDRVTLIQDGATPYLNINPVSQSVGNEAGTFTFDVTSNVDWTVSDNASWLTTSISGSTIEVNFEANPASETRAATITAKGGGLTQTVTVSQAGKDVYLNIDPKMITVGSASGSKEISVESSNSDWCIEEDCNWFEAEKVNSTKLKVKYEPNQTEQARSSKIKVSCDNLTDYITIYQEGSSSTTPVTEIKDVQTFKIYPNPVGTVLRIQFDPGFNSVARVSIIDISGKLVFSKSYRIENSATVDIDMREFNSGYYFLKVNDSKTQRIIKL